MGAGPGHADGELGKRGRSQVVGVDVSGRAEEACELQRLAAGPRAGIEPSAPGGRLGGREDELRSQVLDLDAARAIGFRPGDVGLGEHPDCRFKRLRAPHRPAAQPELGKDLPGLVGLESKPERRPPGLGVEFLGEEQLRTVPAEPGGKQG